MPITQHWLIPEPRRPKLFTAHPTMSLEEIRVGTQGAWDRLLQLAERLGARRESVKSTEGPSRVRADLEAVSPDVREHRHRDRQRARAAVGEDGAAARPRRQAAVPRIADARAADAGAGAGPRRGPRSSRRAEPPGCPDCRRPHHSCAASRRRRPARRPERRHCRRLRRRDRVAVGRRSSPRRGSSGARRSPPRSSATPTSRSRSKSSPSARSTAPTLSPSTSSVNTPAPAPRIDIPGLIADRTIDADAFIAISVVDERGGLVATNFERVPGGPLTAADRPHFTVHVPRDSGKVFVGQPILSRLTGKSTVPISRRINKPGRQLRRHRVGADRADTVHPVLRRGIAASGRRDRDRRARRHLARAPRRAAGKLRRESRRLDPAGAAEAEPDRRLPGARPVRRHRALLQLPHAGGLSADRGRRRRRGGRPVRLVAAPRAQLSWRRPGQRRDGVLRRAAGHRARAQAADRRAARADHERPHGRAWPPGRAGVAARQGAGRHRRPRPGSPHHVLEQERGAAVRVDLGRNARAGRPRPADGHQACIDEAMRKVLEQGDWVGELSRTARTAGDRSSRAAGRWCRTTAAAPPRCS